jgi:hypothetical protein
MGSIVLTRRLLEKQDNTLRDLERRILLLKPSFDPASGPPGKPRKRHGPHTTGIQSHEIVRLLRRARRPMSIIEISAPLTLPPGKASKRQRVRSLLIYLVGTSRIVQIGEGRTTKWATTPFNSI